MSPPAAAEIPQPREELELEHHPQPRQYVRIGIILAIVTAFEVAIYYIESLRDVLVPMLLAFAFIKFFLVATWFMHLRFDSKLFRRLFVAGLLLALAVFGFVMWMFFSRGGPTPDISIG
jgi:cytochrome c oxidase subunit 4